MCLKPKVQIITGQQLEALLDRNIPNLMYHFIWDGNYYLPTSEEWQKILQEITATRPSYLEDRFDCENFAMWTASMVAQKYQYNSCGVCIGQSPWGYHGFNIIVPSDAGLLYYEPQTGDFEELDGAGYKADYILIG